MKDLPLVMQQTCEDIMRTYKVDADCAAKIFDQKMLGKCECCGKKDIPANKMHIDHNHKTGLVRGVVCASCNVTFGRMESDAFKRIKHKHRLYQPYHWDWIVFRGYPKT